MSGKVLLVLALVCLVLVYNVYGMDFSEYINNPAPQETSQSIRAHWHHTVGVDIFAPYFTVRLWETQVKRKLRVRLGWFVGSLSGDFWSSGYLYYIFRREF